MKQPTERKFFGLKDSEFRILIILGILAFSSLTGMVFLLLYHQFIYKPTSIPIADLPPLEPPVGIKLPPTWTPTPTVFLPSPTPKAIHTSFPSLTPAPLINTAPEPTKVSEVENQTSVLQPGIALNSKNYPEIYGPTYLFGDVDAFLNKRFSITQYIVGIQNTIVNNNKELILFLGNAKQSRFRGTPIVVIGLKDETPYRRLDVNDTITIYGIGQGTIEITDDFGNSKIAPLVLAEGYFIKDG